MANTTETVEVLLKDAADLAETLIPPSGLVGRMVIVLAKQIESLTGKTLEALPAEVLNPQPPEQTPAVEQTPPVGQTPRVSDREQELADRLAKLEAELASKGI